ncbi:spectrin binding protein [Aureococcus anophagefferens]|uniref:Spectrin binding protein n=1 Tax=Aureococcus anophagefferens TaxID=44056 RepID=A0ABR1GFL9_AURAN
MGAGASAQAAAQDDEGPLAPVVLKGLPGAMETALFVREKWPLVVDPTEQAGRFLRYQRGSFLIGESMRDMDHEHLRQLLVGCLKCGSMMTITYETLQNVDLGAVFKEGAFPRAVLDKRELFKESVWAALLRPDQGDPPPHEFLPRDDFALCVVAKTLGGADVPEDFRSAFCVVEVKETPGAAGAAGGGDAVEAALGAKEVRRNSPDMVEFAFDGELDEVRALIDKGYYVDSVDGRKHTPLSDACAQGHVATVEYLLELGADPNSKSDLSRTPMWRAAYNGEAAMVALLLEAGGDPTIPTTDFERPFDVAKDDATRDVLSARVRRRPGGRRGAARRRPPRAGGPRRRPRGSCRREVLRSELVELAVAGKTADVKAKLEELADDADAHNERPRATANTARDDRGATLLHLAAQHGHLELAELLLTHAATLDPPHVLPGDECTAAKVFFVNVNRRDAKGWTPLSVAVFHDRKRLAKLLLDHGGDPNLANQFGHTAFDVAKDQVASDERTVLKDKSEVRAVLEEWDRDARSKLFGTSGDVKVADGAAAEELPAEGTGVALQVEMAADDAARDAAPPKKKKGAGAKKAAAAVGRMSAKKGGKKKK